MTQGTMSVKGWDGNFPSLENWVVRKCADMLIYRDLHLELGSVAPLEGANLAPRSKEVMSLEGIIVSLWPCKGCRLIFFWN